jgi:hypothetical protein
VAEVERQIHRLTALETQDHPLNLGKWFIDMLYNPELKLEWLFWSYSYKQT